MSNGQIEPTQVTVTHTSFITNLNSSISKPYTKRVTHHMINQSKQLHGINGLKNESKLEQNCLHFYLLTGEMKNLAAYAHHR